MINCVNVGPAGTFEKSGDYITTSRDIDALFQHLQETNSMSLVLHWHGGLVKESAGIDIASKMASVYRAAGAYPLTFVWETGLLETFRDNLIQVHHTELFQKLLKWLLRRVAQRFGGFEGRGAGVPISMAQIEAELAKPAPFASYDDTVTGRGAAARGGEVAVTERDLDSLEQELEAEFHEDIDSDEEIVALVDNLGKCKVDADARGIISGIKTAKILASIAFHVIRRHVRGRDHGFYPTVVEELLRELYLADLGAWVWNRMKDKAKSMWLPNQSLVGDERHVGTYMLEKIAALQANRPNFRLDLVGHSAGSIAVCEMLRAVAEQSLGVKVNSIVFLAPAGRSDLGVAQIVRHPERYSQLRIYTMADNYEREDQLVPKIYTRSLLYFISGVLEPDEVDAPIMGMMRHATRQGVFTDGPAAEWAAFMTSYDRLVLSDSTAINPGASAGRRSSSRTHGGFDDDNLTQESLIEIMRI